ncbi:MAG: DUF721 domain-containing protein [Deltaproteobacteria bacterium]|nr:DUF721 domain-containing protein [Deltaproteobacteria bacterium]
MTGRGPGGRRKGQSKKDPALKVDSILAASFPNLGIAAKLKEYKLLKAWKECVGPNIAKRSIPTRLIGGTLYCAVSSSPWMTELNYQKREIIERLNRTLGESVVKEIILRVGEVVQVGPPAPLPPSIKRELTGEEMKEIEETTKGIKDKKLQDILKRIMEKAKGEESD